MFLIRTIVIAKYKKNQGQIQANLIMEITIFNLCKLTKVLISIKITNRSKNRN